MNWRHYAILFAIGFAVPYIIAQYQTLPGYMDADYYFAGGIRLATGKGFTEPYIWNYIGDPQSLPIPSHTYWMPLASMISAALLSIFSHYYAPSMPVPDNYAIYMLLGGVFLWLAPRPQKWIPFVLGILAGLMTLARSDGLL